MTRSDSSCDPTPDRRANWYTLLDSACGTLLSRRKDVTSESLVCMATSRRFDALITPATLPMSSEKTNPPAIMPTMAKSLSAIVVALMSP